jgi:hypothetical protein
LGDHTRTSDISEPRRLRYYSSKRYVSIVDGISGGWRFTAAREQMTKRMNEHSKDMLTKSLALLWLLLSGWRLSRGEQLRGIRLVCGAEQATATACAARTE